MKDYLDTPKTILFTDKMVYEIQKEADRLNVSFSAVVRDCIQNDLPKFKQRHRIRKKRGTDSGTDRDKH